MAKSKQFKPSQSAENKFARQLRKVARHSAHIVEAHRDGVKISTDEMDAQLLQYSKLIAPWASRQSGKMIEQVARKNRASFTKNAKEMGRLLRSQVAESEMGFLARQLIQEQVDLITSLPLRAGLRAQKLAEEAVLQGQRASRVSEIIQELDRTGEVSEADADRIARTEVARTNSMITEARAVAVGSRQYIWRNSGDGAVRDAHDYYHGPGHKKDFTMDGVVFNWDSPPKLDDGTTGHPGTFPNCRCYPEPFFPKN